MKTFKDSRTPGKFTPQKVSKQANLIEAYWAGDFGDVEFTELALEAGMALRDINQVMADVREEDGTL